MVCKNIIRLGAKSYGFKPQLQMTWVKALSFFGVQFRLVAILEE